MMPVYDKNGEILSAVYNKNGNIITIAYDKSGNVIYNQSNPQKKEWNYADYSVSTFFQYPISSAQSFSIYDGKIAQIQENNSLHVIDIESGEKIRNVTMDMGHGNSCQFSDEFYNQDDEFPLYLHNGHRPLYGDNALRPARRLRRRGGEVEPRHGTSHNEREPDQHDVRQGARLRPRGARSDCGHLRLGRAVLRRQQELLGGL